MARRIDQDDVTDCIAAALQFVSHQVPNCAATPFLRLHFDRSGPVRPLPCWNGAGDLVQHLLKERLRPLMLR
jgi:hypothetical protein